MKKGEKEAYQNYKDAHNRLHAYVHELADIKPGHVSFADMDRKALQIIKYNEDARLKWLELSKI